MKQDFEVLPFDRIFFDKSKSYVRDYSIVAMTANGAGITVVITHASAASVNAEHYFFPLIAFFFGLILAFVTHAGIWLQNHNFQNSEKRDAIKRFYNDLCDAVISNNMENSLNEEDKYIVSNLKETWAQYQNKSLSIKQVVFVDRLGMLTHFVSLLLFLVAAALSINSYISIVQLNAAAGVS